MKYHERKQIAESYLPRVVDGMSLQELEYAVKEEVKYDRDVTEIIRIVKKHLEEKYLDTLPEGNPTDTIPSFPLTLDESVRQYLHAAAETQVLRRRNLEMDRLIKAGVTEAKVLERSSAGEFTMEEFQARKAARRAVEAEREEQRIWSFSGRIDRKTFGKRLLLLVAAVLFTLKLLRYFRGQNSLIIVVAVLVGLPMLVFLLGQMTKRMRDMELPLWLMGVVFVLMVFFPAVLTPVAILLLLFVKKLPIGPN